MKAELSSLVVVLARLTSLAPAQGHHPSLVPSAAVNQTTCISHVTVIDTGTGKEVHDRAVVISKDRISAVKASNEVHTSACGKTIDGTGKYLIPGLWDMHSHMTSVDSILPLYNHLAVCNGLRLLLARGYDSLHHIKDDDLKLLSARWSKGTDALDAALCSVGVFSRTPKRGSARHGRRQRMTASELVENAGVPDRFQQVVILYLETYEA